MNTHETDNTADDLRELKVDSEVEHTEELTKYHEDDASAMVQREPPSFDKVWGMTNTLPDQGTGKLLSRSYELATSVWSSADPQGTNKLTLEFPKALFAIPWILSLSSRFAYFRCKAVEITLRANSTPFHFGALAMSHVVGVGSLLAHGNNWKQRLNNSPHLLNVMEANIITLTIPWNIPRAWFALPLKVQTEDELATVTVDVLSVLYQDADSTQDVDVSVFARFVEPELQGPVAEEILLSATHPRNTKGESQVTQKKSRKNEANVKEKENDQLASTIGNAVDTISQIVDIGSEVGTKLLPLLAMMDKPSSQGTIQHVEVQPGRDMAQTAGVDGVVVLGTSQAAGLAVEGKLIDGYPYAPTVAEIAQKPSYFKSYSVSAGNVANSKFMDWPVYPGSLYTDYVNVITRRNYGYSAWVAGLFRFWRGSMKYMVQFFTSRFTSMRIRIVWSPLGTLPPTMSDDETGDYVSMVVDVTGSKVIEFSVPFLAENFYRNLGTLGSVPVNPESYYNGYVGLYVVNTMVNADRVVTPHAEIHVWGACGGDIQFNGFQGNAVHTTLADKETQPVKRRHPRNTTGESCVFAEFEKPFEPIIDSSGFAESGLITTEEYVHWTDLGKRYAPMITWSSNIGQYGGFFDLFTYLCAPFIWKRGSVRARLFQTTSPVNYMEVKWGNAQGGPTFATSGSAAQFLPFEVPWIASVPFDYVQGTSAMSVSGTTLTPNPSITSTPAGNGASSKVFRAFGDDFMLGGLYSPPAVVV